MNNREIIIQKNRRKSVESIISPKIDLSFSSALKLKVAKEKLSISARNNNNNKNNLNKNNNRKRSKIRHKTVKNDNQKGFLFHKPFQMNIPEMKKDNIKRRNSVELLQTKKTKKFFERYSLMEGENKRGRINNNDYYINYLEHSINSSMSQLENNIKKVLNNMRIEIEKEEEENFSPSPKKIKNKLLSTPNLKIFFIKKKKKKKNNFNNSIIYKNNLINDLNLSIINDFNIKKSNSYYLSEVSKKKLYRKIKNKLIKKIEYKKLFETAIDEKESSDENTNSEDTNGYSLHPNSNFIFIFDILVIISNLFSSVFYPLIIAKNEKIKFTDFLVNKIIIIIIDIIYIADLLISFFRGYYNDEMKIIRNNKKIIIYYLQNEFIMDLIESLPLILLIKIGIFEKDNIYFGNSDLKTIIFKLFIFIKPFKILKILKDKRNKALDDFYEYISKNYYLEAFSLFIIYFLVCCLFFHLFICFHIFLSFQSYPNWISHSISMNESFFTKYITSFYFLITTVTTVGYGDIICISSLERIFHIILLAIGTIVYTFIVSKIGNYLRDQSHEQIKLSKDLNILENIRVTYPSMSFKLYSKIQHHLLNISKTRKKTGISLLINGIPDTIKNDLLFKIYSKIINEFTIFKGVENSRFVLQMLTSFISIISKKEEILLVEGESVENIILVKDGRISMEIAIDLNDDPYESIQMYLQNNFGYISNKEIKSQNKLKNVNTKINIINKNYKDLKEQIDNVILEKQKDANNNNSLLDNCGISADLGRLDLTRRESDLNHFENYDIVKIFDIRKNEYFGDVHMILKKPSPFTLKAKSRIAEILILRKRDAMIISNNFPNIWRKIYEKSYHNLVSLKKLAYKILKQYYDTHFYHKKIKENKFFNFDNSSSRSRSFFEMPSFINHKKTGKQLSKQIENINIINTNNNNIKIKKNKSTNINFQNKLFEGNICKRKSSTRTLNNKLHHLNKDLFNSNSSFHFNQTFFKPTINIFPKEKENILNISKKSEIMEKSKFNENMSFGNGSENIHEIINKKSFNSDKNLNKNASKFSKLNSIKDEENNTSLDYFNEIIETIKNSNRESINDEILTNETVKYNKSPTNINNDLKEKEKTIYTLEDINENFSKRIKRKLKMKKKIEKLSHSWELQRKENNKNLIELYSNVISKKLIPFIKNKNLDMSNLQNDLAEELINITNNTKVYSNLLNSTSSSDEDIKSNKKFDNNSLKEILSESFEIKSSYKNINLLTKGKIIKNSQYKKFFENLLKKNLNKKIYTDIEFKTIVSKFTGSTKKNKTKEGNFIRSETEKYNNDIYSENDIASISKKKLKNKSQKNIPFKISNNNLTKYLNKEKNKKITILKENNLNNLNNNKLNELYKNNLIKIEKNNDNNNENGKNKIINFLKENLEEENKIKNIKDNKTNQFIINNNNNLTNNKSYTSTINIFNDTEKNNVNKLEMLNRNENNSNIKTINNQITRNYSKKSKCIIY